jgi:predicted Zn-dependent protease
MRHAFSTESFFLDYSLFTVNAGGENKAVKVLYAGREWEAHAFEKSFAESRERLKMLKRDSRALAPGHYRVFFAPTAVESLLALFSWGAVSYRAWKKGDSALKRLIEGKLQLSPLFSLGENFNLGLTPGFNNLGEVAPERLEIVTTGALDNLLISSRTAQEYGVKSNGAESGEGLRSLEMATGELDEADIPSALNTGIYVSNLHYLNWSDLLNARITGMTRYACFWVENGEIVSPITDLRFDESLYRVFGTELEAVTRTAEIMMKTDTYLQRSLGGSKAPGMLVRDFRFTL